MNPVRHATFNKLLSASMLLSMLFAPLGPTGAGAVAAPLEAPPPARAEEMSELPAASSPAQADEDELARLPVPPYLTLQVLLENERDAAHLEDVQQVLDSRGQKATFYVTLDFAQAYPQAVGNLAAQGHELGALLTGSPAGAHYEEQVERIGQALDSVRQAAGLAGDAALHVRFNEYTWQYDQLQDSLRALEELGVPTLSGVFLVGDSFFCHYCADNSRLMYPLPSEGTGDLVLIPLAVGGGGDSADSARAVSSLVELRTWLPLDDALFQAPSDMIAAAGKKYADFAAPSDASRAPALSDGESHQYPHDKFLTLTVHPSITGADEQALSALDGLVEEVAEQSGGMTSNTQLIDLTIRAVSGGYIGSLRIVKGSETVCPGGRVNLTVEFTALLYCPTYYFRIYGKYPSESKWRLHDSVSRYVRTGAWSFGSSAVVPAPPAPGDDFYTFKVVGQSCMRGGCNWPTLDSYERDATTSVNVPAMGAIQEITVSPANPQTTQEVTLQVPVPAGGTAPSKVEWTIVPVGTRTTMLSGASRLPVPVVKGDGNPYKYTPLSNTHGAKRATATLTFPGSTQTCQTSKDFNLFFVKKGDENGDGTPNWFEHWKADGVRDEFNDPVVGFDSTLGANSYGYYDSTNNKLRMGGAAGDQHYSRPIVITPTGAAISFGGPTVKGIDTAAEVLVHELRHKWVADNWKAGGAWVGKTDTDRGVPSASYNDRLPDDFETGTVGTYITKTDSFDLQHLKSDTYKYYGDEEFHVMVYANGQKGVVANDWANPGKQSNPAYLRTAEADIPAAASGPASELSSLAPDALVSEEGSLLGPYTSQGVDADSDGKYNVLEIAATALVSIEASYDVVGWLEDGAGQPLAWARASAEWAAGSHGFALPFDGQAIWASGLDGPYTLARVELRVVDDDLFLMDVVSDVHTTASYAYTDFDPYDAALSGVYSDAARDTGSDGQYDALDVTVGLDVQAAGAYTVSGVLLSLAHPEAGYLADALASAALSTSGGSVTLSFDGRALRQGRADGPYQLAALSVYNAAGDLVAFAAGPYTTTAYAYTDFQAGAAELSGVYSDQGLDTNSNSRYDILRLSTEVSVSLPGVYSLVGSLSADQGPALGSASAVYTLSAGLQALSLDFDGLPIGDSGFNGPYRLAGVSLLDSGGSLVDFDPRVYSTTAYAYSQFEVSTSISGTVRSQSGLPLAGVTMFAGGPSRLSTETDANGQYLLTGVMPGSYELFAIPPASYFARESSQLFTVYAGAPLVVDFTLAMAGGIVGRVTDANGDPVTATLDLGGYEPPHYSTDANGYYTLTNLAVGDYTVHIASDPAYGDWWILVDGRHAENGVQISGVKVVEGRYTVVDFRRPPAAPAADLYVDKSIVSGIVGFGEEAQYRVRVRNLGNLALGSLRVTDTLPAEAAFVAETHPTAFTMVVSGSQTVWTAGSLPAYGQPGYDNYLYLTARFAGDLLAGTLVTNSLSASAADAEANTPNNSYLDVQTAITPTRDLRISKSLSSSTNPMQDSDIQYQLYYVMSGNSLMRDVVITDTLPPTLSYKSETHPYGFIFSQDGNTLTWRRDSMANESGNIYLTVHVSETAIAGEMLTNTAQIAGRDPETDYANNQADLGRAVVARTRDMAGNSISLYRGVAAPGNELQYRVDVRNYGNSQADDVVMTHTLPASVTYLSWEGDGYNPNYVDLDETISATVSADRVLAWNLGAFAPDGYLSLYVTVRVDDGVQAGELLSYTTEVTTSHVDIDPGNNARTLVLTAQAPTKDVYVSKSLSGSPTPGNTLRYNISYANQGNTPVENVVITDTLPVSTTYLSSSGPFAPTLVGRQLVWDLGSLPGSAYSGYNGTLYVTLALDEQAPVGTVLTNTAVITTTSLETGAYANQAQTVHTVRVGFPNVYVYKSFQDNYAAPGSEVRYRITYGNTSSDAALNVVLTDTLPAGVSYVRSNGPVTPTQASDSLRWELGTLPGSTANLSFDLTAYIASSVEVGSRLTNTVVISAPNDSNLSNNSANDGGRTVVTATRDLSVSKYQSSGYVVPGADATYQIYYNNSGTASARGVVLTDTLPEGTTFVSAWQSSPSNPFTPTQVGNLLVWDLGTLPAPYASGYYGYVYVAVRLSEALVPGAQVCNQVDITTVDLETGTSANTDTDCRTIQSPTRDVYVTKYLDSGVPVAGNIVIYRVYYNNAGNSPAANVVVTDTLPAGVDYDPAGSASDSDGWSRQVSGSQVTWTRPALNAGESGNLYVSARLPDEMLPKTVLTNTVQIATSDVETDYGDNTSTLVRRVLAPGRDLVVSKSWTGGQRAGGQTLTYRIDYRNGGVEPVSDVIMTDTLPVEMAYYTWNYSSYYWQLHYSDNVITLTRTSLPGGAEGWIDLTVTITDPIPSTRVLTNTVEIAGSDVDNDPSDNIAHLPLTIHPAARDLSLTKSLDSAALVPGAEATYRLYYRNYGNAPAEGVLVADTLPAGFSFVSASGGVTWTLAGNDLVWQLGTVAGQYNSGYYGYLYLTVRVPESAVVGSQVCNQALITTGDAETGLEPNAAERCDVVQAPRRDVRVTKSASPAPPGETMRYTIRVYNDGNVPAHDIVVTDTLPAGASYESDSNSSNFTRVLQSGNTVVWTCPDRNAGSTAYLYLTVRVTDTAVVGQMLTNTVQVSASGVDEEPADNVYTHTVAVAEPVLDMSISKSMNGSIAPPGGTMEYRLYVANSGNVAARDIVVTDTLPAGVSYVSDNNSAGFTLVQQSGDTLVWTRPQMATGAYAYLYLTVRLADTLAIAEVLTNTAQVSANAAGVITETNQENNMATLAVAVSPPTRDVYVMKWAGTLAAPGGMTTYQLYFGNWGNATARDVVVTDTLPPSLTLVSWSGYLNDAPNYYYTNLGDMANLEQSGDQLVWRIGDLAPGQYGYVYPRVRVAETAAPGQVLTNVVRTSTSDEDIQPSNNVATDTSSVADPTRDMTARKWLSSGAPVAGQTFRYGISFENEGNSTARGILVTDTLPAGASYVSWYGSFYNPRYQRLEEMITPTVRGGQVIWQINPLLADGYGYIYPTFHLADSASPGEVLTNVVRVSTTDVDVDAGDDAYTHTATVITPGPDMYVYKSLSGRAGWPGGDMRYSIYFSNDGREAATDVVITDTLPEGTAFESWYGYAYNPSMHLGGTITPSVNGRQVSWRLGQVPAGQYGYIYPNLRISSSVSVGTVLTNVVSASTSPGETDLSDNVYTDTSSVISPTWDVYVEKYLASGYKPPAPGGETRYRLYFSNQGNQPAANVVVSDTLPPGAQLVAWDGYVYNPNYVNLAGTVTPTQLGGQVAWHIGALADRGYGYIYLTVRIDAGAQVRDLLVNAARISTSDPDSEPADNVYTYTTRVILPRTDVYVEKYLSGPAGAPGGEMAYSIYFENSGSNWPASDLVITDTLPPEASFESWYGYAYNPDYVDLDVLITPTVNGRQVVWRLPALGVGGYGYLHPVVRVSSGTQVGEQLTNIVTATSSIVDPDPSDNAHEHVTRLSRPTLNLQVWKGVAGLSAQALAEAAVVAETPPGRQSAERDRQADPRRPAEAKEQERTAEGEPSRRPAELDERAQALESQAGPEPLEAGGVELELARPAYSSAAPAGGGAYPPTGTVAAGHCFSYAISFENTGNIAAPNVVVTDVLPAGVSYQDWSGYAYNPAYVDLRQAVTPSVSGSQLVWNLGQVAGGGYGTLFVGVCASSTLQVDDSLVNRVDISTGGQEETLIDNSSTATVTVSAFVPLLGIDIHGPATGTVGLNNAFTTVVTPSTASRPIAYTWSSDGLVSGQGTAQASYRWTTVGVRTITVTASNDGAPVTATHTITIGEAPSVKVTTVLISGPTDGQVGANYAFTATAAPPDATPPINYTWSSEGLVDGQGGRVATYRWTTAGAKTISVTASNAGGSASDIHIINLTALQPVTDTVGPDGGVFVYTNTTGVTATFEVPPGAVGELLELRYTPTYSVPPNGGLLLVGNAFELDMFRGEEKLTGYSFTGTVTLTIRYSEADLLGPPRVDEDTIVLYRWVDPAWQRVGTQAGEGQSLDTGRNTLKAWLRGLSLFGKFGEGAIYEIYLPVVIKNG
ncbi:MAG: DUF11 domain-containing protein [Thermoflexales bacterium]|nr:DUF11 domain-containing protein [Thermoflexales bacterium]